MAVLSERPPHCPQCGCEILNGGPKDWSPREAVKPEFFVCKNGHKTKRHPRNENCKWCLGQMSVGYGEKPCPCVDKRLGLCPICGFAFGIMPGELSLECYSIECMWCEELAQFAKEGSYQPPPGWRRPQSPMA